MTLLLLKKQIFFGTRVVYNKEISLGHLYTNIEELSRKFKQFHLNGNWEFTVAQRERTRYVVICKDTKCKWKLSATPKGKGDAWIIKDVKGPHTCKTASTRKYHTALTVSVITDVIMEDIKKEPSMSIKEVARAVRRIYPYITPHYNRLWRGRELAVCRCFRTSKGSYNLLAPLLITITGTNPGTRFQQWHLPIDTPGEIQFKGIAWAFGPCIEAFRYVRPVISIDACLMSGRYGGALLIACAYDAEN